MDINNKIKKYIKDNGLKYYYVAEKSGINPKKFSKIINGHKKLTVTELEIICEKGLEVNPSYFFD
jgi:transcriptional regulator with XRE-family HTH domain